MKNDKIIHIITLGCSKNITDSEHVMRQIEEAGYTVTHNSQSIESGIVIINTCGFIKDAKQESIDMILEFAHAKSIGQIQNLYVFGCLSEIFKNDLEKEIPEVDAFFGAKNMEDILKELGIGFQERLLHERVLTTPKHYAYLKISEGCSRSCAFCIIPVIRGKHLSLPIESVIAEANKLASQGVRELILIAQDLGYYGIDLYRERKLNDLLKELVKIEEIEWIRLHYTYPHQFPIEIIETIKNNPKICHYLDIPIQHISDKVLRKMRRGNNQHDTFDLLRKLRSEIPDLAIRTTLLVGHPDETEDDFNALVDFIKEFKFDRLGVFTYSHEEFSYAYSNYEDNVPEKTKILRQNTLMLVQQNISNDINKLKIGKKFRVLVDRLEGEYWIGRTEYDSPEVDNEVLIKYSKEIQQGEFYNIRITNANEYDLTGELAN